MKKINLQTIHLEDLVEHRPDLIDQIQDDLGYNHRTVRESGSGEMRLILNELEGEFANEPKIIERIKRIFGANGKAPVATPDGSLDYLAEPRDIEIQEAKESSYQAFKSVTDEVQRAKTYFFNRFKGGEGE